MHLHKAPKTLPPLPSLSKFVVGLTLELVLLIFLQTIRMVSMQNKVYISRNKQAHTFNHPNYHLQGTVLPLKSWQHLLYHSETHGFPLPIIRKHTKRNKFLQ